MPPDTSVSDEQITTLFRHHGLTSSPKMNRIMAGFTNEIHQVDDYILKICVRENHLDKFQNEAWLYRALQGKVPVPKLIIVDDSKELINKPYMIYEKIVGETLG